MTQVALTHTVGSRLGQCELTFVARGEIDVERARHQHDDYCAVLRRCGADVRSVDVSPDHPDAVFVEDAVVVLDELVVATSMGAASRRAEVDHLLPMIWCLAPNHRLSSSLAARRSLRSGCQRR